MTQVLTIDTTKHSIRAQASLAGPWIVICGAVGMIAVSLFALVAAIANLVAGLSLSEFNLERGFTVPAAVYDGVSSGTWTFGYYDMTQMYDGDGVPSGSAKAFAQLNRDLIVPFFASESINALLIVLLPFWCSCFACACFERDLS